LAQAFNPTTETETDSVPEKQVAKLQTFVAMPRVGVIIITVAGLLDSAAALKMQAEGSCDCLNFATVYSTGLAKCGDAVEKWEHQVCDTKNWYPRLNSTHCPKMDARAELDMSSPEDHNTWCYVSAKCQELRNGQKINSDVSMKSCTKGERLADLSPTQLMDDLYIESEGTKNADYLSVAWQLAYPMTKEFKWSEVASFWDGDEHMDAKLKSKVQDIVDSGTPMIICENEGEGDDPCGYPFDYHIVYGKEVWKSPDDGSPVCTQGCGWPKKLVDDMLQR